MMYYVEIMDAVILARNTYGRKKEKVTKFQELLIEKGLNQISFAPKKAVPLPSAPSIFVQGINPTTATMFKSALYPALLEFQVSKGNSLESAPLLPQQSLSETVKDGSSVSLNETCRLIVKCGDDLRQDQLVMQMIRLMDGLLKRSTLDLCLRPYSIIATHSSPPAGLVEYVEGKHNICFFTNTSKAQFNYEGFLIFQDLYLYLKYFLKITTRS